MRVSVSYVKICAHHHRRPLTPLKLFFFRRKSANPQKTFGGNVKDRFRTSFDPQKNAVPPWVRINLGSKNGSTSFPGALEGTGHFPS